MGNAVCEPTTYRNDRARRTTKKRLERAFPSLLSLLSPNSSTPLARWDYKCFEMVAVNINHTLDSK